MGVNPSNSAAVDLVVPGELDDFWVCNQGLAHQLVLGKKLCARSAVNDQQPPYKIVTEHFIAGETPVECVRVRFRSSEETDPYRRIDKNHLCTASLRR
jgi:hypothetical protein